MISITIFYGQKGRKIKILQKKPRAYTKNLCIHFKAMFGFIENRRQGKK